MTIVDLDNQIIPARQQKWDRRFLFERARQIASWSKDPSTQCGAVIYGPHNTTLGEGFNGLPRGLEDKAERLFERDTKLKLTVHAEKNAIYHAGQSVRGASIAVWPFLPCPQCAAAIIQCGIARVVTQAHASAARWDPDLTREILLEAGVILLEYVPGP
jgi:dCMP deaminase